MKIAITGGIGSGKSRVRDMLVEKLDGGFVLGSIDSMVSKLYADGGVEETLRNKFGTCDKAELSKLAFEDPKIRKELEDLFGQWLSYDIEDLFENENVILEFPLLFEKGQKYLKQFDIVINVSAAMMTRVLRVCERDHKSSEDVYKIISAQASDGDRNSIANYVIYNEEHNLASWGTLEDQVDSVLYDIRKSIAKDQDKKIGIVSGSFDPITLGHTWVIQRALDIVDYVVIAVATNTKKKYLFNEDDRVTLVRNTLKEILKKDQLKRIIIDTVPSNELTVSYAASVGAKFIFRGLRGFTDLEYENQLNLLQKKIAPDIETVFLLTPRELIEISSSLIKGALALREWERVAAPYVSKCVLQKLKEIT